MKNKNRKENANDQINIIFSYYACINHGVALLGCAKR